jgi:nucleoside-diphosphate-sugar epimerase
MEMTYQAELGRLAGQRVLITGASGFLGRKLTQRLIQCGAEVHGISRADRVGTPGPSRWWRADMEDFSQVIKVWDAVRPDLVYHLSGVVNGAPDLDLLIPTYKSLLTTTVHLLERATRHGCRRIVLAGSLEEDAPADDAPPASPYGAAKSAAREYARLCHGLYGTPVALLRTFMAYGPGQPAWKLIPSIIGALRRGLSPRLSSGERQLDWIYVDDVIEGYLAASVVRGIDGLEIDIGTGELTSIRELAERLAQLINPRIPLNFGHLPDRPRRPSRRANRETARAHLGWSAQTTLDHGLKLTVEAHDIRDRPAVPAGTSCDDAPGSDDASARTARRTRCDPAGTVQTPTMETSDDRKRET